MDQENAQEIMKIREFKIDDYPIVRNLWLAAGLILRPGDELEEVN